MAGSVLWGISGMRVCDCCFMANIASGQAVLVNVTYILVVQHVRTWGMLLLIGDSKIVSKNINCCHDNNSRGLQWSAWENHLFISASLVLFSRIQLSQSISDVRKLSTGAKRVLPQKANKEKSRPQQKDLDLSTDIHQLCLICTVTPSFIRFSKKKAREEFAWIFFAKVFCNSFLATEQLCH